MSSSFIPTVVIFGYRNIGRSICNVYTNQTSPTKPSVFHCWKRQSPAPFQLLSRWPENPTVLSMNPCWCLFCSCVYICCLLMHAVLSQAKHQFHLSDLDNLVSHLWVHLWVFLLHQRKTFSMAATGLPFIPHGIYENMILTSFSMTEKVCVTSPRNLTLLIKMYKHVSQKCR